MESNENLRRGAGEEALLPPRPDWPPKAAGLESCGAEEIIEEGAGAATAGYFKRGKVEVVAKGVQVGLRDFAEVGAFGVATTDQAVELRSPRGL